MTVIYGCDSDERRWEERLKKVAKQKVEEAGLITLIGMGNVDHSLHPKIAVAVNYDCVWRIVDLDSLHMD
jgi:uncharacterized GH25 family protein